MVQSVRGKTSQRSCLSLNKILFRKHQDERRRRHSYKYAKDEWDAATKISGGTKQVLIYYCSLSGLLIRSAFLMEVYGFNLLGRVWEVVVSRSGACWKCELLALSNVWSESQSISKNFFVSHQKSRRNHNKVLCRRGKYALQSVSFETTAPQKEEMKEGYKQVF